MADVVIDTNVAIVANGKAQQASEQCTLACIDVLIETQRSRRVRLDDLGLILDEYRLHLSHSGQPGLGDAFFKWLWNNQAVSRHCRKVKISSLCDGSESFKEFPEDAALADFDRSDRKFVATALAMRPYAKILNATDTDWWKNRVALERHGLEIRFICPELMTDRR